MHFPFFVSGPRWDTEKSSLVPQRWKRRKLSDWVSLAREMSGTFYGVRWGLVSLLVQTLSYRRVDLHFPPCALLAPTTLLSPDALSKDPSSSWVKSECLCTRPLHPAWRWGRSLARAFPMVWR